MPSVIANGARLLARLAAPMLLAAGLSACSSIPDWVDPTTWTGGDSQVTGDQSATNQDAAQASDTAQAQGATPDLASIPPRPAPPSTADEQKQVANSLEADRAKAQYSADALKGGTEAAAPPPSAAPASSATPPPAGDASANPPPPAPDAGQYTASSADQSPPGASGAAEAEATPATTSAQETSTAPPAPAAGQVASTDGASTTAAAAAPLAAETTSTPAAADMQTTFAPSKAPALDPSVAQFVPQPILSRYQQTAAGAAAPGIAGATNSVIAPPKHRHHKKTQSSNAARAKRVAALGEPERNADVAVGADEPDPALQRASFVPGARDDTSAAASLAGTVLFPRDATILGKAARYQVETAAQAFAARGGRGYVRIVGHSSSRAAEMSLARHEELDFARSQARATAVARELIRDGVPADRVLVEAVGDAQPAYSESMSQGEDGNRRAEIFLQS